MIRIALASLRSHTTTYAGAFLALTVGTGIVAMMTVTLWAVTSTEFRGPQRFASAPVVVTSPVTVSLAQDDGGERTLQLSRPRELPMGVVRAVSTIGRSVVDRDFPVHLPGGPDNQVGHAWSAAAFTPYRLIAGRPPTSSREIVVGGGEPSLIGRTVRVAVAGDFGDYKVVGVTRSVWFENAVFFADAEARRVSPGADAVVSYASAESVREAVTGAGVRVLTGRDRLLAEGDQNGGRDQLLDAEGMAGTSLMLVVFVVVFVVVATFAFVVEQRRREVALLRTVGATPRQVRLMILAEAFLLAVLASAIGCAVGVGATGYLREWMISNQVAPAWLEVEARPAPLVVAFLLGLASAMIATAVVCWRAGRVRPAEALREATGRRRAITPVRIALGCGLLVVGIQKSLQVIREDQTVALSMQNYLFVPVLLVGGCALLTPLFVKPVAMALAGPLGRHSALAMTVRENSIFAARRTAALATPVALAVGLGAALFTAQSFTQAASGVGLRMEHRADFVVTAMGDTEVSAAVVDELRAVPGAIVSTHTPTEIFLSDEDDRYLGRLSATAVELRALTATRRFNVVAGSLEKPNSNSLVLDRDSAQELQLRTGDHARAWLPDGSSAELRVAAQTKTTVSGAVGYLPAMYAAGAGPTRLEVKVAAVGDVPAVAAAIESAVQDRPVQVSPRSSLFDAEHENQQRKTRLAVANIFGIALAFALLAIANTIVMAASDRRRELSTLTLAGATRRDRLRFVIAETVIATIAGTLLGVGAATAVSIGHHAALTRLVGAFPVTIPWALVLVVTAACVLTAVVTSAIATQASPGRANPRAE